MGISIWMGIVAGCSALIGFSLNSVVILVRIVKRKTMTTFQLLLTTIAFNDMVLSLLFGLLSALMLNDFKWIYHPSSCKVLFPTVTHFMSVNVGCIFTVSYERYTAIVHPFKPRFSMRKTIIVIHIIWVLSIASAIPNIISLRMQPYGMCTESWNDTIAPKIYSVCLLLMIYALPLAFIIAMHVRIIRKLRKAKNRLDIHQMRGVGSSQQKLKRNVQTIKLLVYVVVAFSLLVLPTKLYYLVWDLAPEVISENAEVVLDGYKSLYYIHVIINPILYSLTNAQFRRDLKDLMLCRIVSVVGQTLAMKLQDTLPTLNSRNVYMRNIVESTA